MGFISWLLMGCKLLFFFVKDSYVGIFCLFGSQFQNTDENETHKTKKNKVHIFWEGHKILRNLHIRKIYGGDFSKICGLLTIYELYQSGVS